MSRTKSPNLELFSERTSSIYRNVKLKDRASFFSFFLRNPLLNIFLYWKLHNWLTPNTNALKKMMQYWLIDWLLFNSVKWGLFQQYACQEQVYEQCIMKVKRLQVGKGIWQKFRLLLEKDYVWKRSAGNVLPCSEPPTTTSNKNLAHWVQYLISPLPAKAEGD
jgi:hypothetical protein